MLYGPPPTSPRNNAPSGLLERSDSAGHGVGESTLLMVNGLVENCICLWRRVFGGGEVLAIPKAPQ